MALLVADVQTVQLVFMEGLGALQSPVAQDDVGAQVLGDLDLELNCMPETKKVSSHSPEISMTAAWLASPAAGWTKLLLAAESTRAMAALPATTTSMAATSSPVVLAVDTTGLAVAAA